MSQQQRQQAAEREAKYGPFKPPGGWVHPYAKVLQDVPPAFYDYQKFKINWASVDPYELHQKVGRGKYSEVFVGRNRFNQEKCVIKVLKPVKNQKILREVSILQHIFGGENIIHLLDCAIEAETQTPVLVFEAVDNVGFRELYPRLTDMDVRYYMFQIIKALESTHRMGIMHRDIKPHNIMIDHTRRLLRVIDWGLAEYFHFGTAYNVRVASRYYKGPELLVGYRYYDYSLDMWSLGCVLAGIIFAKEPLFHGRDNTDQLVVIAKVMGTRGLMDYIQKYDVDLPDEYTGLIQDWPRIPWTNFIPSGSSLCNPEAMDFLDNLLRYDHAQRILAKDALNHPYFDPVRNAAMLEAPSSESSATTSSSASK